MNEKRGTKKEAAPKSIGLVYLELCWRELRHYFLVTFSAHRVARAVRPVLVESRNRVDKNNAPWI